MGGAQVNALIGAWHQIVGNRPGHGRGGGGYRGGGEPRYFGGEEIIEEAPYGVAQVDQYGAPAEVEIEPGWHGRRRDRRDHAEVERGWHGRDEHVRRGLDRHVDVRGWMQIVDGQGEVRNELIEEPGPDRAGREILPMSSGTQAILPNHSASITARPQRVAFRPERVFISENGDGAANWLVNDILIGNRSQFSQAGQIPGDIFATTAIDSFVSFETAQTAMDVVMVITYVGPTSDGQPFYGAIIGTAAV